MAAAFGLGAPSGGTSYGVLPELLQRVLEWPPVGLVPAPFYISIHYVRPDRAGNPVLPGRPATNYVEAAQTIGYWQSRSDVYFCTATLTQAEVRTGRTGQQYRVSKRQLGTEWSHKCLYVDIDAGKPKGYPDHDAARLAFDQAVAQVGLPPPTFLIASGTGGFHAYWSFDAAVKTDRWQPLANRLANALEAVGLIADFQCTVDGVRVLRVPGTLNYKPAKDGKPPAPVQQIGPAGPDVPVAMLEAALASWPAQRVVKPGPGVRPPPQPQAVDPAGSMPAAFQGVAMDPAFGAAQAHAAALSVERQSLQCTIDDVAAVCPFIAATLANGGLGLHEPLWKETINIAVHIDSRDAAHRLSSGHPGYSAAETDRKYDTQFHVKHGRAGGLGWTRCATINAPQCGSCPHQAEGKSPLNFVIRQQSMQALLSTGDDMPPNYRRTSDGCVEYVTDDGKVRSVTRFPIHAGAEIIHHLDNTRSLCFTATLRNHLVDMTLRCGIVPDTSSLLTTIASYGLMVSERQKKDFKEFIVAWIQHLQDLGRVKEECQPLGWHERGGFVTAETHYTRNKPPQAVHVPALEDLKHYKPAGTYAAWRDSSRLVTDMHDPAHNVMLAAAFASPLLHLLNKEEALWLSTHSLKSGIGKTTTLEVMQTVWGSVRGITRVSHTHNSLFERLGMMHNYPFAIDDLRPSERHVSENILQMISGTGKLRLDRNIKLREVKRWNNLTVSCSNHSIHDKVLKQSDETAAQVLRVFEYEMPDRAANDIDEARYLKLKEGLQDNYGHAGERFGEWLASHADDAKRITQTVFTDFTSRFGMQDSERYWFRTMAVLFAGGFLAHKLDLVGFTSPDLASMRDFLGLKLDELRGTRHEARLDLDSDTVIDDLVDFIRSCSRDRCLRIDANGMAIDTMHLDKFRRVDVELRPDVVRIAWNEFREWQDSDRSKRRRSARQVLNEAKKHGAVQKRERMGVLANSFFLVTQPVLVLEFDPRLAPFAGRI